MIRLRPIAVVAGGKCSPDTWRRILLTEPVEDGDPIACKGCPFRVGGELEAGLLAAIDEDPSLADLAPRWGCHDALRPCAGALRISRKAGRQPSGNPG